MSECESEKKEKHRVMSQSNEEKAEQRANLQTLQSGTTSPVLEWEMKNASPDGTLSQTFLCLFVSSQMSLGPGQCFCNDCNDAVCSDMGNPGDAFLAKLVTEKWRPDRYLDEPGDSFFCFFHFRQICHELGFFRPECPLLLRELEVRNPGICQECLRSPWVSSFRC